VKTFSTKDLTRTGAIGALALVFPMLFHALHIGHLFLPMYLPLLLGAFVLPTAPAIAISIATPLLSAVGTGMPPLALPAPIALWMAIELGAMTAVASLAHRHAKVPVVIALAIALLVGRVVTFVLVEATARVMLLPPGFVGLGAVIAPWPGLLTAMIAVPAAAAALMPRTPNEKESP
jgi:hypothetical protein